MLCAGRTFGWSRCSMLATPFYICVYLYTCPIDYLDFCSSRFLTSGLRTSGLRISRLWTSSHLESWPWTSGLRASGFQTSGHPDFWPFRFLPASIKCLDQDIFGLPCRIHQSQIPNVLPAHFIYEFTKYTLSLNSQPSAAAPTNTSIIV